MSNIPSNAISASLDALQRPTNESLRARRVQAQKEAHHHEDVEELDDTAVDSVRDQAQQHHEDAEEEKDDSQNEENVDIQSLKNQPPAKAAPKPAPPTPESHLDISA